MKKKPRIERYGSNSRKAQLTRLDYDYADYYDTEEPNRWYLSKDGYGLGSFSTLGDVLVFCAENRYYFLSAYLFV